MLHQNSKASVAAEAFFVFNGERVFPFPSWSRYAGMTMDTRFPELPVFRFSTSLSDLMPSLSLLNRSLLEPKLAYGILERKLFHGEKLMTGIAKVFSIGKIDPNEKAIDLTRHLSGDERVSMVEDLRRQTSKVTQREYPRRLRRVFEIAHRA